MRIVFIGASKFGLRCLKFLENKDNSELVGAVTVPEEFSISYRPQGVTNYLHANVKQYCADKAIPCIEIKNGMKDTSALDEVKKMKPDVFIVCGWYHLIPASWRAMAPMYGMHASLLPDYSGGAPLVWAMINGESKTGISLFQLSDGVDNGPIVGQAETDISDEDDIASLYERIEGLGLDLLAKYFPQILDGTAKHHVQDESYRRVFSQRSPEDGLIDWKWDARAIWNFIRAQTRPYPGAFTLLSEKALRIWSSRAHQSTNLLQPHGYVKKENKSYFVQCSHGWLELLEIQYEGEVYKHHDLSNLFDEGGMILGN